MQRKFPTRIGELIDKHIRNSSPFVKGMKEDLVTSSWAEVVGENIANYTTRLYVRDNKLYVGFTNPTVKSEFFLIQRNVLYKLNGKVGEQFVKRIIVLP